MGGREGKRTTLGRAVKLVRPWPDEVTEAVTGGLAALAEPSRLEILEILDRSGPRRVQALADTIGTTQQNASKHLAVLRAAGLLQRHRKGRLVCYAVVGPDVYACTEQMAAMMLRHLPAR